jgi:predicted N-acetyltransferase YhbS
MGWIVDFCLSSDDRSTILGAADDKMTPGHPVILSFGVRAITMNTFHIRDAREEERAAIRDLTLVAYAEYATIMASPAWEALRDVLRNVLDAEDAAERIVAERGGALVGSVMLYPAAVQSYGGALTDSAWPELRLLAVSPVARGQGVGAALVEECLRRARRSGASTLGLHTSESMRAAMHMYERMGFVRVPEHDFRVAGSELVMGYRLPLET